MSGILTNRHHIKSKLNGSIYRRQPLKYLLYGNYEGLLSAYSVEKLCFASGAKIHAEFDSILRAIASNG